MSANRPPLDEQPAAVNFALALWVGVMAGVIGALGGFDDPRWWMNGWVRLATLGATAAALAIAFHTPSGLLARRLQLGVVTSLLLHTLLAVGMSQMRLETEADPFHETPEQLVGETPQPKPEVVVVRRDTPDQTKPDFEQPLALSEFAQPLSLLESTEQQPQAEPSAVVVKPAELAAETPPLEPMERMTAKVALADNQPERKQRSEAAVEPVILPSEPTSPTEQLAEDAPAVAELTPGPPRPRAVAAAIASPVAARLAPAESLPALAAMTPPSVQPKLEVAPQTRPSASRPSNRTASRPLVAVAPLEDDAVTDNLPRYVPSDQPSRLNQLSAGPSSVARFDRPQADPTPPAGFATPMPAMNQLEPATATRSSNEAGERPRLDAGNPLPRRRWQPSLASSPASQVVQLDIMSPSDAMPEAAADTPAIASMGLANSAKLPDLVSAAGERPNRTQLVMPLPTGLDVPPTASALPSTRQPAVRSELKIASSSSGRPRSRGADAPPRSSQPMSSQPLADITPVEPAKPRRPATAFSQRVATSVVPPVAALPTKSLPAEAQTTGQRRPTPKTEAAIELGLKFLTRQQQPNGSWSFGKLPVTKENTNDAKPTAKADGAATGLALLSLLGAGYDHFGGQYQESVQQGLDFLVANQQPDGALFPEADDEDAWQVARFYSHGMATIALCEAFGMTGDAKLREPAQRAIDYLEKTQVPRLGGWRYSPGVNADLSVTGWQLMALRSGELAGLRVNPNTYKNVRRFVEACRERTGEQARFCYNPLAPADDARMNHGRRPGTVMTSVGLLMQLYLGADRDSPRMRRGADHLLANLPTNIPLDGSNESIARISTIGNPLRDTYYWYYATQVMFHMRGNHWQAWNDALHPLLAETQSQTGDLAGSWNPQYPAPDRWSQFGGRLYVTTMNLLSLEVYYRHLPLYEVKKLEARQ